jgi:hypothetical protein
MKVPHALEFNGLIEVPLGGRPAGIYWLRFYRGTPRSVAVLTEVPGNPSLSITNAMSRVSAFAATRFSVDLADLIVFEIWPRQEDSEPSIKRVTFTDDGREEAPGSRRTRRLDKAEQAAFTGRPDWWSSTRRAIEKVVGMRLAEMPAHDELYALVKALGGGTTQEIYRRIFTAIDVNDLPPPHNPSSCHYISRFSAIQTRLAEEGVEGELEAGRRFLSTLSPEEWAQCPYHEADWAAIADESVSIIERLGPCEPHDYFVEASRSSLGEEDRGWLLSLFRDPVDVAGGSYTNGQHRGCALRFSGAQRAAVVTDIEFMGMEDTDWVYQGEG